MKKLLSILLALCMVISLCAAFSTVSFADETATDGEDETTSKTTYTAKEFLPDEYDATKESFSITVKDKRGLNVMAPSSSPSGRKWDVAALKWIYENGYEDCDDLGKEYQLTEDGHGGYTIGEVQNGNINNNVYKVKSKDNDTAIITKANNDSENITHGGYTYFNVDDSNSTASTGVTANQYPIDYDISLDEKGLDISGVRIYRTYNGDTTINEDGSYTHSLTPRKEKDSEDKEYDNPNGWENHGSYVTKYDLWVKFKGETEYTPLVEDATNSDNQNIKVDLGYNVTVTDVRIRIKEVSGTMNITGSTLLSYYTTGAMTVLKPNETDYTTYSTLAALAGKDIDSRVPGSLENKNTIEAAKAKYGAGAVADYEEACNAATVQEVDTEFATSATLHYYDENYNNGKNSAYHTWRDVTTDRLTDRKISNDYATGNDFIARADYSVYPENKNYLTITLPITGATDEFTGIRFYSRKGDAPKWNYQKNNSAKTVKVTLYGESETTNVTSGVLYSVLDAKGVYKAADDESTAYTNDDKNWMEAQDYRYVDIPLRFDNKEVKLKEVTKIVVEVQSLFENHHWGSEEVRLINDSNVSAQAQTISELKNEMAKNAVDERVKGSLEHKRTLEAAETEYSDYDYATEKKDYDDATVKEVETTFGTVTAAYYNDKSEYDYTGDTAKKLTGLTDDILSPDNMVEAKGQDYYINGCADYAIHPDGSYTTNTLTLTIPVTTAPTEGFTGIRFYNRKSHMYNYYQKAMAAENAKVTLYDSDSNAITSGTLTSVLSEEHGIVADNAGNLKVTEGSDGVAYTTKDANGNNPYAGQYDKDIRYVDFKLDFGAGNVRAKDVKTIVVEISKVYGNYHWGSEEVRLINDSTVTGGAKTVAEIKADAEKAAIKANNKIAITTVQTGEMTNATTENKGVINIITKFEALTEPSIVEYFGTYVVKFNKSGDANPEASDVTAENGKIGFYEVSKIDSDKLTKDADYSVKVTGIKSDWYNTPVYAISFMKVNGLDELIFSDNMQIEKVDSTHKYSEATTETTGTEE